MVRSHDRRLGHHRGTVQGVVTIDGKDFYLGKARHGTAASKAQYARLIADAQLLGKSTIPIQLT